MKTKQWLKLVACLCITVAVLALVGCAGVPRVKLKGGSASGPKDIGTPATVETGGTVTTVALPAGSTVESTPGTPATGTAPASPPAVKVTLAAPSELRTETHAEKASTGTVDSTVAVKRIEVESAANERRPLLWVAIGCGVVGVLLRIVLKEWPAWGNGFMLAGVLAGVAWKVAEVPWWAWLAVLVAVGLIVAGYKRAEWDANGNGVPDVLEGKR